MAQYPILVLEELDGVDVLSVQNIDDDQIPESLNGESGFHMFHVRMLTELILEQVRRDSRYRSLSDEDVSAIAIASATHDVGKKRIPKSILEFPGKLSPLEYDIVKKHAALGAELLLDAESDGVDPKVLKYAAEIARSHHERFDGTGYPDGTSGQSIPISAQVVSLADAFDALTSSRSYKDALSQDVAIEMISNGMCGVFDPVLVECLLSVVNHKVLMSIRERVQKERAVVADPTVFVPKRVLLIGNTGYLTEKFIDETFYSSHVTIVGDSMLHSKPGLKVYNIKNPRIDSIFETYEFDVIIYFANELSFLAKEVSDVETLRTVLQQTKKMQPDAKFLYLSSLDAAFAEKTDRGMLTASKEKLCEHYGLNNGVDMKVVRIPYLYSGTYEKDFLYGIFKNLHHKKLTRMDQSAGMRTYFLSLYDLSDLLLRLIDNWRPGSGILTVNDAFNISFAEFHVRLSTIYHGARLEFMGEEESKTLNSNNKALRNEYGWFSKISILDDLEEEYEQFVEKIAPKELNWYEKLLDWIQRHQLVTKLAELFGLFILTELLMLLTDSTVIFKIVDFRMAYIVIMATVHGLTFGMGAAGLSSVAWLVAKLASGTKWETVFYEPTNWLAFVFYFLVGALCGYVRLRSTDAQKFLKEQNTLLEEKLSFTRELYEDTFSEKRDLKKQIIGSKDSFGKIFDATRNLDTVEPRELYLRIMDTFENILENKTISVYSITENSVFGRLEVASRDVIGTTDRSISLEEYAPIIKHVESREVWKNTEFLPDFPMYAAGVYRGSRLELLIFINEARSEQRSLYYVNLFKIMRDLVQLSLLRALDYNRAVYEKQYIPGTRVLNAEAFAKHLENFRRMSERKVFVFQHLTYDMEGRTVEECSEILERRIRANDILGLGTDGKVHILLSQASKKDLDFVLPRFANGGLTVTVVED